MNKNQRIVHGQGTSNITYSTVNFNFNVCQVSSPVSSTNYGVTLIKKQRIVHGKGASNITYSTINSTMMFAEFPDQFSLLTIYIWFHFDQATCNVNKSDVSASRNSSQNAGNHENLYSIRGVKSNIQLSTVSLNKIIKSFQKTS